MDRHREKIEFHSRLGMLFKPLVAITGGSISSTRDEQTRALAQFAAELPLLVAEFRAYCDSEVGHRYEVEAQKFTFALEGLLAALARTEGADLAQLVAAHMRRAHDAVDSIPTVTTSAILAGGRPFSAYLELRAHFESAQQHVTIVDPYLDQSVFYRYLSAIGDNVETVLVTTEPPANAPSHLARRWREFLDVSRVFAAEKGNLQYRLVAHGAGLHDRWMYVDNTKLLHLGGSIKDAGRTAFTMAPIVADSANLQKVDDAVRTGRELFGPSTPNHQ